MPTNLPPITDPTTLGIGTIGIAYGFTFIVQDDPQKGLYWKEIDPELDWDNIEFWTLGMDLENGQVQIIPKSEKLVVDGVEREVDNPIPIRITFSNRQVLTKIQDYGTVYTQQNNWSDLLSIDPKTPFSENNRQVKQKLTDDIGVQWKFKERLKTDLEENVFYNDEENSKKVYDKIIGSWIDIFTWVNDVVTKYYKDVAPEPKFKIGDFVKEKKEDKIYKVFAVNLNKSTGRVDYGLKTAFADTLVYRKESDLETTEQPKFKRDDIVKYIADNGKKYKIEFITYQPDNYVAQLKQIGGTEVIGAREQDIELAEDKTPKPKFKVGDRVTFNKMPFATFRVMDIPKYNSTKGKFVYRLANEDGKSSFSASYEEEMSLIVVAETPKDCEADASKIISGQVKRFYDLNKTRIEKLDTKISCKIIQALVGLSEYESCGSPSSSSLQKPKTDLLSRISNLKI